eukprot:TRINITY_DN19413_c0_g1_i1.p1 TRINITY_DN19413_c0_g1~~TRINITY_DN19413_c0_g1_i1.p1  ORF type:complete len:494 (-),score=110.03 TRINITY_DN19413_c0_g1_i1:15-1451(-)
MGCSLGKRPGNVSLPEDRSNGASHDTVDPASIEVLSKEDSAHASLVTGDSATKRPSEQQAPVAGTGHRQSAARPRVDCWRGESARRPSGAGVDEAPRRPSQVAVQLKPPKEAAARQASPASVSDDPTSRRRPSLSPAPARQPWRGSGAPAAAAPKRPARRSTGNGDAGKANGKGANRDGLELDDHEKTLLNEVLDEAPGVSWDAIAGLEGVKNTFWEVLVAPVKNPALFSGVRSPPRGVLLFGPPGNGKTLLAKAVATECEATFFSISASSLTSKWVGESEKHMRGLFSLARKLQPSVIFMDEIDSMLTSRSAGEHEAARRLKTEFLVQLDGVASSAGGVPDRVFVLGATNRPGELDDAVLRRLPRRILIPLPDAFTRSSLICKELKDARHDMTEAELRKLSGMTDGYSCSDLAALTREAAMGPVRGLHPEALASATPESLRPISLTDFKNALKKVRPSLSKEALAGFETWNRSFGSG